MDDVRPIDRHQGGETHQTTDADHPVLTTNHGMPIADNQNQLKAGHRGPVLLEDHVYREKINHFDHERIPERIVHARGTGAHGYFELTHSLADVTRADLFQRKGDRVEVFVRFSTVAGGAGSVDTPAWTCVASPSNSTPGKATGTSSATTSPSSSSGCNQVPRPHPRRQNGGRSRLSAGRDRA